jgi:vancomycin resistance protein VanJ
MDHNKNNANYVHCLGCAVSKLVWTAISLYGVIITLWLALKLFGAARWSPVEMLGALGPVLFLPALVCVPLSLWRRHWRLVLMSLPALMALVIGYGIFFLPRAAQAQSGAPAIHFLTYNIHAESEQIQPMLDVIRSVNADVVALQELSPTMAEKLATDLRDLYPYQALHPNHENAIWGQGVLSRYPILEDEYWRMSLGHQRVKITANGLSMVLYNTHPVHPFLLKQGILFTMQPHRNEVDEVLRRVANDTDPVIVAGDFNMSDQVDDYTRITQHLEDTYREAGWGLGFTFPDFSARQAQPFHTPLLEKFGRPVARIDFIFHSNDLQALSAQVWPTSGGSDHRPVVAEFTRE